MSKTFWLANYFAATSRCFNDELFIFDMLLDLGLESINEWTKYEFDGFTFSKVLSGDRFVYFVCSETNRLVEVGSVTKSDIVDKSVKIKIRKRLDVFNQPSIQKDVVFSEIDSECHYIKDFMGNPKDIQYYMGGSNIYLLDKTRIGVLNYVNGGGFVTEDYSSYGGIRKFICGPLSPHHVVLTNDGRVLVDNKEISLNTNESTSIIRKAACCGSGVILCSDYYLYVRGENTFNVYTTINNTSDVLEKLLFKFPSQIKEITCGYYHTMVLLEDGSIYTCGYNVLKQSSFGIDLSEDFITEFKLVKLDFGVPKEIACSSRGNIVRNTNGDVFMAGEIVSDFPESNLKLNHNVFCFNIDRFDTETFNAVSAGGWQYVIYYDAKYEQTGKDEIYMKQKLEALLTSGSLSDVVLISEETFYN